VCLQILSEALPGESERSPDTAETRTGASVKSAPAEDGQHAPFGGSWCPPPLARLPSVINRLAALGMVTVNGLRSRRRSRGHQVGSSAGFP
jgi:hypothetical protein